ncbi:MAG: CHAT domain-containing protein, partial [Thermoanaerobaculia bacterium]
MKTGLRAAVLFALSVAIGSLVYAADPPRPEIENTAREFIRLAYDGRFDELARVWGGEAAGKPRFETPIRNALRVRCLFVENIAVTAGAQEDTANVVVALRSDDGSPLEIVRLGLRFAKGADRWHVTAVESHDQALALQLIAANEADRARILAENKDLLTKSVVRTIYQRSVQLLLQADPRPAEPVAALARDVAILAGDRPGESLAKGMVGITIRNLGRMEEAMQLTRESLEIAEETGDALAVGRAHINMYNIVAELDRYSPAIDHHLSRALAAAKRVDDPTFELRVMTHMRNVATNRRDLVAMRRYTDLIARRLEVTGDPLGDLRMQNEHNLALIYIAQGDFELALHHADSMLQMIKDQDTWYRAHAHIVRGHALRGLGRNEEARITLSTALELARIALNPAIQYAVLSEFAAMTAEGGNLDEAECLLREASVLERSIGYPGTGDFHRIVFRLVAAGRARDALRLSLEQASVAHPMDVDFRAHALVGAAEAYRALGMRDRALAIIQEAIEDLETFQERIAGSEIQHVRSSDAISSAYEIAAELALAEDRVAEALSFIDRGRGRVLHDLIENGRPHLAEEADRADRETQLEYEQRLTELNIELARADSAKAATLRGRLSEARREYESFVDGLRARSERRVSTRPRELTTDDLARQIPVGMVMVVYVVRDAELHILTARRSSNGALDVQRSTSAITREEVEQRVDALSRMMNQRDLRHIDAARDLYSLLIAPVEKAIAGSETLCIVPDESLWRVPFAALADREGRFLIEKMPIVYSASISVYGAVTAHRAAPRQRTPESILAIANPLLHTGATREVTSVYRNVSLGALPDAEVEADALCRTYDSAHCTVLKRQQATESRTKSEIGDRNLVHFATHGLFDDGNPMYSRLLLARGDDAREDGSLEAWEIARLDLDADLIVLSACDTARGHVGGGEGVVGMAWSFFVAGARSTVATQWPIGGNSTAELMIAFHQSLAEEQGAFRKARALRAAQ